MNTAKSITVENGMLQVPEMPIIPFIEGMGLDRIFGKLRFVYLTVLLRKRLGIQKR